LGVQTGKSKLFLQTIASMVTFILAGSVISMLGSPMFLWNVCTPIQFVYSPLNPDGCGIPVDISIKNDRHLRIAVVEPVFTTTAYSSFYKFFSKYAKTPQNAVIRQDLDLLNATLVKNWGYSGQLFSFIDSPTAKEAGLTLGNNTFILTDIDVSNGGLFSSDGSLLYNVVILGFSEYVTANEYLALKHFVLSGGKLIVLSATNFLAEVSYNAKANKVSLVRGHGWLFNGTAAWKSDYSRWKANNTAWVGSEYGMYIGSVHYTVKGAVANTSNPYSRLLQLAFPQHQLFKEYGGHEENFVTNTSDSIIAYWNIQGPSVKEKVAIYELKVGKGTLIHMGIFGVDILQVSKEFQFLLLSLIGVFGIKYTVMRMGCDYEIRASLFAMNGTMLKPDRGYLQFGNSLYPMYNLSKGVFVSHLTGCHLRGEQFTIYLIDLDMAGDFSAGSLP
jgi:uncharacterized membrane protein